MADMIRTIPITIPDAFVARLTAYVNAAPPLMEDSGEVDAQGDPILVPVVEGLAVKFDRIAGEILRKELKERLMAWERKAAANAITEIEIE